MAHGKRAFFRPGRRRYDAAQADGETDQRGSRTWGGLDPYPAMGQPGRGTDADGDGVFEPSPCYAWNNTLNGGKLNMALRRWGPKESELQAGHVKEGRDFFNQAPQPEYYKPYVYPHPLQGKI